MRKFQILYWFIFIIKIMAKWLIMLHTALTWWFCFRNTTATGLANETDLLALTAIKDAIYEHPFGVLSSWNDSVHYCDWKGILCSRRHRHRVIELNLMSQGLVGSLSPHIGNLSFLNSIILQNNSFHGPIPQEIGRLFRLQVVEFSNNSFGGRLPTNLSRCSNLKYLNLIDNNLTGNILAELFTLSKLGALGLAKNKLSGTIPPSIGNLSSLSRVSFFDCNLQGEIPQEIARLRGLDFIQLSVNNLSGKIPSGLFNISTISVLALGMNRLRGSIPSAIGSILANLYYINFEGNLLTGMIPTSLSNASGLEQMNFGYNEFTGPMPKDLGELLGLQTMLVHYNRLQDDLSFISSLTNCSNLQVIEVRGNLFQGLLPESIANLSTNLSILTMDDNQLHGSIPSGIGNLFNLLDLNMSMNHLGGPIPKTIGKLHNLKQLYLDVNNFTELPSSLGNLTLLTLHLSQNNLFGSIPPILGNCRNLLELDLSYNNFNGFIPPEIMSLSSISIFFSLAHNSLAGSLPPEIGSLKNLAELDVSNNRLSGSIPNSISSCSSLEWLYLEGNSFEGEIPQSLSELRGLRELDLSRNNLSGLIPSYLGKLHLEKLDLSFNMLQGKVPMEGVFQNRSAISVVGNNNLCGGIVDLNLPPCSSSKPNKNRLSHKMKVIIFVVAALVICSSLSVCFFIFLYRPHVSKKASFMPSLQQFLRVSYADLLKATNGFSEANLIGVGSYASVYKGILNQGQMIVAVKVLNLHLKGASRTFMSECKALRTMRHRNLLKILSVCSGVNFQGNEFKALVYEFMANGSLDKWLHQDRAVESGQPEEPRNILKLIQRLDISIDIASALEYLHCGCESTIIHGDLKPSNVLLDDEMTAHVGDFGLTKIISAASSEVAQSQSNSVVIRGTIGYVAPEYAMGGMASTPGDVYSFGILLLEMFTGKRPTEDTFEDHLNLHNFVKNALPERVMEITDPLILSEHKKRCWIKDCMVSILSIGVACSIESPRDRMEMGNVIGELRKIKNTYMNEGLNQD